MARISEKELHELFTRLENKRREAKEAQQAAETIELELKAYIEPGQSRAGIEHQVILGKSVSYAQALKAMREEGVIPKTREPLADKILEAHTKATERHVLRRLEA